MLALTKTLQQVWATEPYTNNDETTVDTVAFLKSALSIAETLGSLKTFGTKENKDLMTAKA